jgi:hypothetical protein
VIGHSVDSTAIEGCDNERCIFGGPIGHQVPKARPGEVTDISRALARAFFEDPRVAHTVPDSSSRLNIGEGSFEVFLRRVWLGYGETYAVGEAAVGVCIWNPPGAWKVSVSRQLSVLPALIRIYGRNVPHLLATIHSVETRHPSEPPLLAFRGR